jgi:hypothetical protein
MNAFCIPININVEAQCWTLYSHSIPYESNLGFVKVILFQIFSKTSCCSAVCCPKINQQIHKPAWNAGTDCVVLMIA